MERGTTSSGSTTTMAEMLRGGANQRFHDQGSAHPRGDHGKARGQGNTFNNPGRGGGANPNMQYGNGGWLQEGD
jgi:hypothetical protein